MARLGTLCSRHGCGRTARWRTVRTDRRLCCECAADVAAVTPLVEFDAHEHIRGALKHGEWQTYRQEIRYGLDPCDDCKLAWKLYKIQLDRKKAAA